MSNKPRAPRLSLELGTVSSEGGLKPLSQDEREIAIGLSMAVLDKFQKLLPWVRIIKIFPARSSIFCKVIIKAPFGNEIQETEHVPIRYEYVAGKRRIDQERMEQEIAADDLFSKMEERLREIIEDTRVDLSTLFEALEG